ncbi:MAG: 5-(carboxyamino)imidazole ribonucleotide mutase [Acetobacteraceae bacterium]|nr:5-(carboxyamino)imidazole ribonucleotide mutase [Acetobacteraceae bacterium]
MGSASDREAMLPALRTLDALGLPWRAAVASAHRSPQRARELAQRAREEGVRVIIAGAGGSAALAGVLAAETDLVVIGVPLSRPPFSGWDALLSTAQMPAGVPVAAVGVDAAENAAWLAARVLALSDPALEAKLREHRAELDRRTAEASERLFGGGAARGGAPGSAESGRKDEG